VKSLHELFQLGKYDAVLEATANSEAPSDVFLRLQCFEMLELYDEWLLEVKRSIHKMLPMVPWVVEKHISLLRQGKITRTSSIPVKVMYDALPYINQSVEELLTEFNEALFEEPKLAKPVIIESKMIDTWLREKKYAVLFDALSEDHILDANVNALLVDHLKSKLPAMIQTYILLFLQRMRYGEAVTFERQGLVFEVVPKDLSPIHDQPFVISMMQEFHKVKDPSIGNIARQLFEKWIAMTFPFFVHEDRDWLLPAFEVIASRYLQLKELSPALVIWLKDQVHQVFVEEIQTLLESPEEQIG
jgi:hypothetical protein